MIDWIKTVQGIAAIVAVIFATVVAWWNLGLPRLVFSPEEMSDTLPIEINSAALGIGRHVSGAVDPFNRHIDEFHIAHLQRSDGWIATTWNNMSDPGAFAVGRGRGAGRRRAATACRDRRGRLSHGMSAHVRCARRLGWRLFSSQSLDEAHVPFFGAFGTAWDDAMVARWNANPLGMLWLKGDAAFTASGGNGGGPPEAGGHHRYGRMRHSKVVQVDTGRTSGGLGRQDRTSR